MAEQVKQTGKKIEDLDENELAQDSRDCLDACLSVSVAFDYSQFYQLCVYRTKSALF